MVDSLRRLRLEMIDTVDFRRSFAIGEAAAELCRPAVMAQPAALFLVLAWGSPVEVLVAGSVALASAYAFGAISNDLVDRERDRLARKLRPLAVGAVSVTQARRLRAGAAVVALAVQIWLAQPVSAAIVLTGLVLGGSYSYPPIALQSRGWLGPGVLVVSYVGGPVALAIANGLDVPAVLVVAMVCLAGSVVVHKDIGDVATDRASGKRTPPVIWGSDVVQWVSSALAALGFVVTALSDVPGAAVIAGLALLLLTLAALGKISSNPGRAAGLVAILLVALSV